MMRLARTGDLSAVRMSDVIGRRRYHELPIFHEYFHPAGLDHMIDVGLPAAPGRHRSFILFRRTGAADFSERDRAVLEMLWPHFSGLEAGAALRRRLSEALGTQDGDGKASAYSQLTPREREIVGLVSEGKTNAQIAAQALGRAEHREEAPGARVREARRRQADSSRHPRAHHSATWTHYTALKRLITFRPVPPRIWYALPISPSTARSARGSGRLRCRAPLDRRPVRAYFTVNAVYIPIL